MGSLTQMQRSVIIGSILGDGCLRRVKGRKDALLEVNHSIGAKDYVDWKYSILENISKSEPKTRKGNANRIAYRFTTRQNKELTKLLKIFYENGRKLVPHDLELDAISLAIWFMDDGSKCRKFDVYFNSQQFDPKDQLLLIDKLGEFGIKARLNKDKKYKRIRILKTSVKSLNQLIHRYIIPSMRYKLSYDPVET